MRGFFAVTGGIPAHILTAIISAEEQVSVVLTYSGEYKKCAWYCEAFTAIFSAEERVGGHATARWWG